MLIAIEGVDGVGKTLQCKLLSVALEESGMKVRLLREPGGTPMGERIRELLLMEGATHQDALLEALLFSASRRQLMREEILPGLAQGDCVLLDRSVLSTWVYQGAVGGVDLQFLETLTSQVMNDAMPDRILLLDLDAEAARDRRRQRGQDVADAFETRGDAFLEQVVAAYREMAHRYADMVTVVDASGEPQSVHKACFAALSDLIKSG